MLNVFEQNDVLVSNGHELPCNFGDHKAGSVWNLIPGVKETMFPHQQDAFEFMWTKLAGGTTIEQLKHTIKSDAGGGCVISHAPGTGKTRLAKWQSHLFNPTLRFSRTVARLSLLPGGC